MNDKKQAPRRRHLLRSAMLLFLSMLVATLGVSYALGWISFHQGEGTFTIEIRTGDAQRDTDQAVKKSKDATVETGKILQSAGKKLKELGGEAEPQPTDLSPTESAAPENDRNAREQAQQTE